MLILSFLRRNRIVAAVHDLVIERVEHPADLRLCKLRLHTPHELWISIGAARFEHMPDLDHEPLHGRVARGDPGHGTGDLQ
jgi:hypothetical protein